MARNKYPEETVSKILDTSLKLFLEKGYEKTTIQDIVSNLEGLTKGAIYHHFKSKEDILSAISKQIFEANAPFKQVKEERHLNGLEKIKKVMIMSLQNEEQDAISVASIPLAKNPRFLVEVLESNRTIVAPALKELIDEGIEDGSINIKATYSKYLSEIFVLLTNLWCVPSIFPYGKDEYLEKLNFIKMVFDNTGLPIFDDEIMSLFEKYYRGILDAIE